MRKIIIKGCDNESQRKACSAALDAHFKKYGDHGPERVRTVYTVRSGKDKIHVEVVNRSKSYVATCMDKPRNLIRVADGLFCV
jgi:hypothetical protein